MLTVAQIRLKCKALAEQYWGLNFVLPIEISKRMSRTMGKMTHTRDNVPLKLTFSDDLLRNYNQDTIDSVIAHEMCHWALCVLKKPYADKHPYFEAELRRCGGSSTRTIKGAGVMHKVVCCGCGKVILLASETKMKNMMKKVNYATTMCCDTRFKYVGCERVEDTYTRTK